MFISAWAAFQAPQSLVPDPLLFMFLCLRHCNQLLGRNPLYLKFPIWFQYPEYTLTYIPIWLKMISICSIVLNGKKLCPECSILSSSLLSHIYHIKHNFDINSPMIIFLILLSLYRLKSNITYSQWEVTGELVYIVCYEGYIVVYVL